MPARPGSNNASLYAGGGSTAPLSRVPVVTAPDKVDELNAARVAAKEAKESEKRIISDAAPIFRDMLQEELDSTKLQILGLIGPGTDKEVFQNTVASLNLYETSMKNLKLKLQNKLRDPNLKAKHERHDENR